MHISFSLLSFPSLCHRCLGQVYRANWLSKNRPVACKVIRVTVQRRHLEESFRKELIAYAELSGAYILKTFGYGDRLLDDGTKECYLITELMHRGSLANVIHGRGEKLSLRRKLSLACQIASGMRKLHAHTMIHRDIRPDNILVSNNYTAKIGDMGIAHIFNPDERHTLVGCLPFMPPEFHRWVVLHHRRNVHRYDLLLGVMASTINRWTFSPSD